jgi:hypothetical protein
MIVGAALNEGGDAAKRAKEELAGIVPISGLQNTYDADYDPSTFELFHLEHGSTPRLLISPTAVSESRIYKSRQIKFLGIIF